MSGRTSAEDRFGAPQDERVDGRDEGERRDDHLLFIGNRMQAKMS